MLRQGGRRILTVVGAVGVTVAGMVLPATSSSASAYNISAWSSPWCQGTAGNWCLFYSPGGENGGSAWALDAKSVPNLSSPVDWTFSCESGAGAGACQQVRNNAASMENGTPNCSVTTWVYVNYVGDYNWVSAGEGGNLTPNANDPQQLRNNEASINYNNCS